MTATADLPNKNIKDFAEKLSFVAADKSIIIDSEDGDKLKLIAKTLMVGETWASITSAAFVWDDIVFTKDDATTVTIVDGKITLAGTDWTDGTDGKWITSIIKTWTVWLVDTYTITYSDASTSTFDVTNGTNWTNWTNGTNWTDGDSFEWLWAYSAGTSYTIWQAVSYNSQSYMCKLASTGNAPTNTTYRDLMAAKGADWLGSGDMLKATYDPTNKNGDAFAMDNMVEGTNTKILTPAERTKLTNTTNTNSWDETQATIKTKLWAATASVDGYATSTQITKLDGIATWATANTKATWAEVDTWTDDAKFVTAKAIEDSSYIKSTYVTDANISTTDITTNNASASKHGFLPKLDNTGTKYLRDDGTWQTPAWGWGWLLNRIANVDWTLYTGLIGWYTFSAAATLTSARATCLTAPTGSGIRVALRKNSTTTNNVITAGYVEIAATATSGTDSTLDWTNKVFAAGDILYVVVTQIGSTISGSDLSITIA